MNFYSIFRTVRLIIKDIFGRKVWRIVLIIGLVLLLWLFLSSKGYCATSAETAQTAMELEDAYMNYFLQYYDSGLNEDSDFTNLQAVMEDERINLFVYPRWIEF